MSRKIITTLLAFSLSFPTFAADDEIVLATAPTHSTEITQKSYQPLMKFLSEKTGKKFNLKVPTAFIEYASNMQAEKYDMLFDGPHLSGWRIDRLNHTPIVRLPGDIKIVVAATQDTKLTSIDDLQYGVRVCAFTPPNMLTMAMLSYFPNPSKQPDLIRVQGFKQLIQCVKSGKGSAAVLRDTLWAKAQKSGEVEGLKLIATPTRAYPERTFTVSAKIDANLRGQIEQLLLSEEGQKAAAPILELFKKKNLVKADPTQYEGLGNLINSVWGFQ